MGRQEVAAEKAQIDTKIGEAAAAAERAARLDADPCKKEVVNLARRLRDFASRSLAPPSRRQALDMQQRLLAQHEVSAAAVGSRIFAAFPVLLPSPTLLAPCSHPTV